MRIVIIMRNALLYDDVLSEKSEMRKVHIYPFILLFNSSESSVRFILLVDAEALG